MKRVMVLLTAALCVVAVGCTSSPAPKATGALPAVTTSPLPPSQTNRLQRALNSVRTAVQSSVLARDFVAALHGRHVVPAGTRIRILPATLRSSGNYAVVRAAVAEPGGKETAIAMLLTRPNGSSSWQVVTLLPTTATTAHQARANNSPVALQARTAGGCEPTGINKGQVPVILVHGFNGGPSIWGPSSDPTSMRGKLSALSGVFVSAFDYHAESLRWVTDGAIGPSLASQILCLANQSGRKVVVVAHSMGGLAVKEALSTLPEIRDDLGLIVTIGTPNDGSQLDAQALRDVASFCAVVECGDALKLATTVASALPALATGSPQIAALPSWPVNVPVYALAGNIAPRHLVLQWIHHLPHLVPVQGALSGSDTLVTTGSALHGQLVRGLGGTKEFDCATDAFVVLPFVAQASCEHAAMIGNGAVQAAVIAEIRQYLSTATLSLTLVGLTFHDLTFHLPLGWRLEQGHSQNETEAILVPPGDNCTVQSYWETPCEQVRLVDSAGLHQEYTPLGHQYVPGQAYFPAGGVMNCPGSNLYSSEPRLLATTRTIVADQLVIYAEWRFPCRPLSGSPPSSSYTQQSWYFQKSGVLMVDDWGTGVAGYINGATSS